MKTIQSRRQVRIPLEQSIGKVESVWLLSFLLGSIILDMSLRRKIDPTFLKNEICENPRFKIPEKIFKGRR